MVLPIKNGDFAWLCNQMVYGKSDVEFLESMSRFPPVSSPPLGVEESPVFFWSLPGTWLWDCNDTMAFIKEKTYYKVVPP